MERWSIFVSIAARIWDVHLVKPAKRRVQPRCGWLSSVNFYRYFGIHQLAIYVGLSYDIIWFIYVYLEIWHLVYHHFPPI